MFRRFRSFILLVLTGIITLGMPAWALEIGSITFKKENLPKDWELSRNYIASPGELPRLEKQFGIKPLLGLANQVFIVNGRCRLQVNFVQCGDVKQAEATARKINKSVGHMNKILIRDNIVVEIMTRPDNPDLKDKVTRMLAPAKEVN